MKIGSILARLSPEDLARFRLADVRIVTAKIMPGAYGRGDIEDAYMRWYLLREEFQTTYGLPEHGLWDIALTTGAVIEADD